MLFLITLSSTLPWLPKSISLPSRLNLLLWSSVFIICYKLLFVKCTFSFLDLGAANPKVYFRYLLDLFAGEQLEIEFILLPLWLHILGCISTDFSPKRLFYLGDISDLGESIGLCTSSILKSSKSSVQMKFWFEICLFYIIWSLFSDGGVYKIFDRFLQSISNLNY